MIRVITCRLIANFDEIVSSKTYHHWETNCRHIIFGHYGNVYIRTATYNMTACTDAIILLCEGHRASVKGVKIKIPVDCFCVANQSSSKCYCDWLMSGGRGENRGRERNVCI